MKKRVVDDQEKILSKDEKIVKLMENNKETSLKNFSQNLRTMGYNLSYSTVRRRLIEAGLKFISPTSKSFLTEIQKIDRFRFAKRHKQKNWNNVLFTDEITVSLDPRNRQVWRRIREKLYRRRFKHYQKIHMWCCFSKFGFGKIYLFKEIYMN